MEFILGIIFTMSIIAVGVIFINLSKLNNLVEEIAINKEIIEILESENKYYKNELNKLRKWKDFLPTPQESQATQTPSDSPMDSYTPPARKYNPDKIKGAFDDMFEVDE